jgi:hypothetical protein
MNGPAKVKKKMAGPTMAVPIFVGPIMTQPKVGENWPNQIWLLAQFYTFPQHYYMRMHVRTYWIER